MGEDEVLAARLAHDARVGLVALDVVADRPPHALEDLGRAGEVDPRQIGTRQDGIANLPSAAGHEVDHSHQRRAGRQVASDRREVERRYREDESFQRPVLHPIPDAGHGQRLLRIELAQKVRVEAPEVDEFRRGVDLGLIDRLRQVQHRCGVDGVAPRTGEHLGGAQEDGGP